MPWATAASGRGLPLWVVRVQASRCIACLRCAVPKQGVVWWESKLEKELR